jgi:hypothetical protein
VIKKGDGQFREDEDGKREGEGEGLERKKIDYFCVRMYLQSRGNWDLWCARLSLVILLVFIK